MKKLIYFSLMTTLIAFTSCENAEYDDHANDDVVVNDNNMDATNAKNDMDATKDMGHSNMVNVDNWPETAKKAANAMIEKYGQPTESTPTMLIWKSTSPFVRTIVYKEEINHDFPMPHKDVLEQFVHYDVPGDKFDELAQFDGSIICERTKGEMSARCDKEGANKLALNLAHDIIAGKKTVQEARDFYGKTIMQKLEGGSPEYMMNLKFNVAESDITNPDKTTMDMSKVKELKKDM